MSHSCILYIENFIFGLKNNNTFFNQSRDRKILCKYNSHELAFEMPSLSLEYSITEVPIKGWIMEWCIENYYYQVINNIKGASHGLII